MKTKIKPPITPKPKKTNPALIGNQFWKLRSKHGRDRLFATPELLLQAVNEYFAWCEKNPLIEIDFISSKLGVKKVKKPKMRPFTMEGLCIYLDANTMYFRDFKKSIAGKNDKISKDFSLIITHIEDIIYNQQFTGAASGFLNPNIIARKLGLTDKSEIENKGIITHNMVNLTDDQIKEILKNE